MQASSSLRETLLFLTNCRLVYAKHQLWEANTNPSPAQPSRAQLSRADPSRAEIQTQNKVASRLREMLFFPDIGIWYGGGLEEMSFRLREMILCLQQCCFVYARHPLSGPGPA